MTSTNKFFAYFAKPLRPLRENRTDSKPCYCIELTVFISRKGRKEKKRKGAKKKKEQPKLLSNKRIKIPKILLHQINAPIDKPREFFTFQHAL